MTARILVVEDEDRARKNMVRLMEDRGFEVFAGSNASEAKDLIQSNWFDVVVTDMLMENEHAGLTVLQAAKERDELTEVIVITAYGSIPNAVDSTRQGAFEYIEKDADDINELLCLKVEQSLNRKGEKLLERAKTPLRYLILERKPPVKGGYDVFLLYNTSDIDTVRSIAEGLRSRGLIPWFDEFSLVPGWIYVEEVERILYSVKSIALIIGNSETPPWDDLEFMGFLQQCALKQFPIIPVILPDVMELPDMPIFLHSTKWVDLRKQGNDPMTMLFRAIVEKTS